MVLAAVVANYIATAEPVGSRTISRQAGVKVSPATIRNVMADLEELGYLRRPHVSAGRVPTGQGLRYYVDSILEVRELDEQVKAQIREALEARQIQDLDQVLKSASRALSSISQQVAVVAAPDPEHEVFRSIKFILLEPGLILTVLVSRHGAVQNRIIQAEPTLGQEELDKFTRYLNELLADLTLTQVKERVAREMAKEKVRFDLVLSQALEMGKRALEARTVDGELFIEGQTNLLGLPEFTDMSQLRRIFQAFEDKSTILRLLEKAMLAQGLEILLGPDSQLDGLEGLSAVASVYGGGDSRGALAVIGPTRMDYSKVIPIVDYTARLVSRILEGRD
jgi:heat-inducible transcriptional repressor